MIANAAVALIGIGLLSIGALAIAAPETAALMSAFRPRRRKREPTFGQPRPATWQLDVGSWSSSLFE